MKFEPWYFFFSLIFLIPSIFVIKYVDKISQIQNDYVEYWKNVYNQKTDYGKNKLKVGEALLTGPNIARLKHWSPSWFKGLDLILAMYAIFIGSYYLLISFGFSY